MAVYKRGGVYWFEFVWNGERVRESTKQGNKVVARQIESAKRTQLAKGEVGIEDRKPAPRLKEFAPKFRDTIAIRKAEKPLTVSFYNSKLDRLLEYEPLASARLNHIDEALIERYVKQRRGHIIGKGKNKKQVSPASVNRELATLRRLLRMAYEWRVIHRVPRIQMLDGERNREFVLSHERERDYLDFAPQPLKDVALLILDTGLRVGEAVALQWSDIHLEPVNGARFGYLHVRSGKSRNARRNLSLTARVARMLKARASGAVSAWVFPGETEGPFLATSLNHQHSRLRKHLGCPADFVIHSLRHTMLTRLGEAGVDAFTIMKIAGHSSVTVSQKYIHPSPEALERAFERLEIFNSKLGEASEVPTIFTTVNEVTPRDDAVNIS